MGAFVRKADNERESDIKPGFVYHIKDLYFETVNDNKLIFWPCEQPHLVGGLMKAMESDVRLCMQDLLIELTGLRARDDIIAIYLLR